MSFRATGLSLSILAGLAATQSAGAETDDAVQIVWDYFAQTCGAAVEAENPATYVARLENGTGGAGQSSDELLSIASVQPQGVAPEDGMAIVNVMVNAFDDGRIVQCSLQLPQPVVDMVDLVEIARAEAPTLLGGEVTVSGGGLSEIRIEDGLPAGMGDHATYLRASRGGFPPDAVLMVQVLPMYASLTLSFTQSEQGE